MPTLPKTEIAKSSAYSKKWREGHREQFTEAQRGRNAARYQAMRDDPEALEVERERIRAIVARKRLFMKEVKETCGCVDCGTREGRLDLDHRDGTEKCFNPSQGPRYSWPRMVAEIMKCDVRCVPCHARRHGLKRGDLNGR